MVVRITKKVGTTGRFKERYGTKIRMKVATVEKSSRAKHQCPSCMKTSLKKVSKGVWTCRSCNIRIAGGAYSPKSPASKILEQMAR